jgi:glycosyltransferase involved in cell wall biosynthesis
MIGNKLFAQAQSVASVDISIILTSYKFRSYLRQAVESLLAQQTSRSFELLVVDDASPERDLEVIGDITDPRLIRIQHAINQGCAKSITQAFAQTRGRLIARYDGDDVWLPHALEDLANALEQYPQADVAYGDVQLISETGEFGTRIHLREPEPALRNEFENLLKNHFTCAPAMLFRRACWAKALPWPDKFSAGLGDWYFNLRFAQLAPFVYVPKLLAYYRVHSGGMHAVTLKSNMTESLTRDVLSEYLPHACEDRLGISRNQVLALNLQHVASGYASLQNFSGARRILREILRLDARLLFTRPLFPAGLGWLLLGRNYDRLKKLFKR